MIDKQYDILIIGSGSGGGVMAKELSELCAAGKRIALLEWGPKLRPEEFTGDELEMTRRLYFDNGGMLTKDRSITLAFGKAYGGSTVVYTGTSLIIPESVLASWKIAGLEFEDIERRSKKYFRDNNIHFIDEELINDNNRLFYEGCQALGYDVIRFPVNVKDCTGSGMCNIGCPSMAKQGTHVVQLPDAEKKGVEVVTNCKVERVENRSCYATVANADFGEASSWAPGEYRIKARLIIVCAGAIQSAALLLRSELPVKLPKLGCGLTLHPALVLAAQHDRPLTNFYGHPKTYFCGEFAESQRFMLETCMYFPFMAAKSMMGFGAEHSEMMSRMDHLQMIIAQAFDAPRDDNRISINRRGDPVVHYRLSEAVLDALHQSMIASTRIFFAAGAKRVHAPASKKFFIEDTEQDRIEALIDRKLMQPGTVSLSAAHMMGGGRMGTSPADSVCDSWGRVHGLDWLYLADSSLFPRCSEVNPYVTIMALADRIAEHIRSRAQELLNS